MYTRASQKMINNIFALVVGQPFSGTLLFGTRKKRSFYSQADREAEGEGAQWANLGGEAT